MYIACILHIYIQFIYLLCIRHSFVASHENPPKDGPLSSRHMESKGATSSNSPISTSSASGCESSRLGAMEHGEISWDYYQQKR